MSAEAPIEALETSRATLHALALADAEALFAVFADPETMRHFGRPHADPAETRTLLDNLGIEPTDPWHRLWAILPAGETACRGWVGLMNRIPDQDNAEFSIILQRAWQGRGIARAAARAAFAFGFDTWGLHRVYATVVPANGPSVRLVETLGSARKAACARPSAARAPITTTCFTPCWPRSSIPQEEPSHDLPPLARHQRPGACHDFLRHRAPGARL